ncbi:MAG: DUF3187 family protein [Longimicrobiales bacterium]|nr:DUF3187 family protein [Longimicrobiales bacterium]
MPFRHLLVALPGIVVVLLAGADPGEAQWRGNGPFRVPEQNPLYQRFLTPRPERAELLEPGQIEFAMRSTYSNIFEFVRTTEVAATLDTERSTTGMEVVWAPSARYEVGVRGAIVIDYGGFLDGPVQEFHDIFNLPNGNRDDVENGNVDLSLVTPGDTVFSLDEGAHLTDPVVWVAVPLLRGRRALAARVSLKLPIGSSNHSTGKTDVGVQLDGQHVFTNWAVYSGLAVSTLNAGSELDRWDKDVALTWHLGGERRIGEGWGILAQFQGSTAFLEGFGDRVLDRAPVNFGVGASGRAGSEWTWQAVFTEDIRSNSPAVDFTFDIHLSRVIGGGGG